MPLQTCGSQRLAGRAARHGLIGRGLRKGRYRERLTLPACVNSPEGGLWRGQEQLAALAPAARNTRRPDQ